MTHANALHASSEPPVVTDAAAGAAASATFERVLREYGDAMARLAAVYAPDADDRADLLQDIFIALWKSLPTFRHDCSERTFVYRVAHNRALTHRRRELRSRRTPLDDARDVADPRANPERDAEMHHGEERLIRAIAALGQTHRQVLMLKLEGLSNGEIGEVLGINENAVAIRLTRARKALAEHLPQETDR